MFGTRNEVDPIRHLIGSAMAWGGNPERDATYLNVTPEKNDGVTPYRLTVRDVPVDGFWSISVYNGQGYFEPNPFEAYTINNLTAKKNADQSVTVHFGTCDGALDELSADHAGLELHRAVVPAAPGNSARDVDISARAARG